MSLRCTISGSSIKAFAQAINCCCKLGEDIYLDATQDKLIIKALNEPYKSAFMTVTFDNEFFMDYDIEGQFGLNDDITVDNGSQGAHNSTHRPARVHCKLKTRSCLLAFKKEKTLAKNLDFCEIKIGGSSDFAEFKFVYRSRCIKTMELPLGCDSLDVNDDIFKQGPHHMTCKTKLLADIVSSFTKEDEYITMISKPQSTEFETHFIDRDKNGKLTKTKLDIEDFDQYTVSEEIFLTYSLRLIKPFLSFVGGRISEIKIFMENSNQPLTFNAEYPPSIKIALALATLDINHPTTRISSKSTVNLGDQSSQPNSRPSSQNQLSQSRPLSQHNATSRAQVQTTPSPQPMDGDQLRAQGTVSRQRNSEGYQGPSSFLGNQFDNLRSLPNHSTPPGVEDMLVDNEFLQNQNMEQYFPSQSTIGPGSRVSYHPSQQSLQNTNSQAVSGSQVNNSQSQTCSEQMQHEPSINLDDSIPPTPNPNKSVDSDYWMSLTIQPESQLSNSSDEILVPPTDSEEEDSE